MYIRLLKRVSLSWIIIFLGIAVVFVGCNLEDESQQTSNNDTELDVGPTDDIDEEDADDEDVEEDVPPEPTCDDETQNGEETDVDCGGPDCEACDTAQSCEIGSDCASEICDDGTCIDASCEGVECDEGQSCYQSECFAECTENGECGEDERCHTGTCLPLDCESTTCAPGTVCYLGACYEEGCDDCDDGECIDDTCVVPTCNDGLQNGSESDVDCGGDDCDGCEVGQICGVNDDCAESINGDWDECEFPEDVCAEEGEKSRPVTHFECHDDLCEEVSSSEIRTCDRDTDTTECADDDVTDWSECEPASGADTCTQDGTQTRTITSYECGDGDCLPTEEEEEQSCTLDTDGISCDEEVEYGDWGDCTGFSGTCGQDGEQERTVTYYECSGGSCDSYEETETQSCTRDTGGETCGADIEYGDWGDCGGFSGTCGEDGEQERTVTTYECSDGSCQGTETTDTQSCSRDTGGDSCGSTETPNWSSCSGFNGTCGESGTQTRTVTSYQCGGGSCQTIEDDQEQSCSRDTGGESCGNEVEYGDWGACGGFSGTCGEDGEQSRTVTYYECSGGSCDSYQETDTQSCSRDTGGETCGDDVVYGDWSSCGNYGGTCDNTGEKTRTVTTYTCSGGGCSSSQTTQTQSCSRNTNGNSCGPGLVYGDWGSCNYTDSCDESAQRSRTETEYTCNSGSCIPDESTDTESCSRNTDGDGCSGGYCSNATCEECLQNSHCSGGDVCTSGNECVECTSNSHCPSTSYGSWSSCDRPGTFTCTGERTRQVTSYSCGGGNTCQSSTTTQTDSSCDYPDGEFCSCAGPNGTCSSGSCDCPDAPDECGSAADCPITGEECCLDQSVGGNVCMVPDGTVICTI